ncbi:MAG: glycoside hydrolase N-terminal domain-containing protein [Clostridia bacterium]|nr:glycoside hydrolase N-terminal domain-containing protein [Clostridia bacterium]
MKKLTAFFLVIAMLVPVIAASGLIAYAQTLADQVIIDPSDKALKLWYDEEAPQNYDPAWDKDYHGMFNTNKYDGDGWERWSLPLGNGYFGVNVFGGTATERLQITEKTLYNYTSNGGLNNFSETYIDFGHTGISEYERYLDLKTATSGVSYKSGGVTFTREYFTSYVDKVFAIKLEASGEGNLNFTLRPTIPYEGDYNLKEGDGAAKHGTVVASDDGKIVLSGNMSYYDIDFAAEYRVIPTGGTMTYQNGTNEKSEPDNGTVTVSGADSAYILVTIDTNYYLAPEVFTTGTNVNKLQNSPITDVVAYVADQMSEVRSHTYAELRQRHINDYYSLFGRVSLDLGGEVPDITTDALLKNYQNGNYSLYLEELYFQYGRYLLISSSRSGALPATLQGVWNRYKNPPWSSGIWHNINVQMNYWPAFSTNLAETFEGYVEYFNAYLEQAQKNATTLINNTNPSASGEDGGNGWCMSIGVTPYFVYGSASIGNLGFTTSLFWDYYDYTRASAALDVAYIALKGGSQFITKMVQLQPDGSYLNPSGDSAEQHVGGEWYYSMGTTYDQSFALINAINTLKAAEALGIDETADSILATLKKQVAYYDAIKVGYSGQLKEFREEDYYGEYGEWEHRHVSHLVGLYPGDIVNSSTPAWLDAAEVALSERGDGDGRWGWSVAHRQSLWARLKNGERAHDMYRELLSAHTFTNLWDMSQSGFQLDGNLGGTAGVSEMLLQSHEGYIEPLAAIPDAWADGQYTGLVARGNFEVSARWRDGSLKTLNILSGSGGVCKVKHEGLSGAVIKNATSGDEISYTVSGDVISFATEAGSTYIISGIAPKSARPAAPTAMKATQISANEYALCWNEVEGATGYKVYKAVGDAKDYTLIGSVNTNKCVYELAESEENARITYRVSAIGNGGAESDGALCYVNPLDFYVTDYDTCTLPDGKTQITVKSEGDVAEKYNLYVKNADGSYTLRATAGVPVFVIDDYSADTKYAASVATGYTESTIVDLGIDLGPYSDNILLYKQVTPCEGDVGYHGTGMNYRHQRVVDGRVSATDATDGLFRFASTTNEGAVSVFEIDLEGEYALGELKLDLFEAGTVSDVKIELYDGGKYFVAVDKTYSSPLKEYKYDLSAFSAYKIKFTLKNNVAGSVKGVSINEITLSGQLVRDSFRTNILRGTSVVQNSGTTCHNTSIFGIGNLTDGITSNNVQEMFGNDAWKTGRYATSSVENATSTFTVALDGRYTLDKLYIDGFFQKTAGSPTHIKVELFDKGEWTEAYLGEGLSQAYTYEIALGEDVATQIRITVSNSASSEGITLSEIRCSGVKCKTQYIENVFSGKTFTQIAGTALAGSNYPVANLTDGITSDDARNSGSSTPWTIGRWATANAAGANATLTMDLGASYALGRLTVDSFYQHLRNAPTDIKVEVYSEGEWTVLYDKTGLAQAQTYTVDLGGKVGTQIRITFVNTTENAKDVGLSISEITLDAETVLNTGFDRTAGVAAAARLVSYINAPEVGEADRKEALAALDEIRVALGNTAGDTKMLATAISNLEYFLDSVGKREAFFELIGKENIIIDYNFDTVVDLSQNYNYVNATGLDGAPCFTGDASARATRVQLVNSAGGLEFVERQGGYALHNGYKDKIGTSGITLLIDNNSTTQSYIDNLSDRAGESFVVEMSMKGGVSMYNKPLMSVYTRAHKYGNNVTAGVHLLGLWGSGEIYPYSSPTTILARLSPDKYTHIAAYVDVPANKYYIYIDGENVTPTGYTFLTDADRAKIAGSYDKTGGGTVTLTQNDFIFGEARIFHNDDIHGDVSFDSITAYYTDRGYVNRASAECWYTPLGIDYNGVNYTYADKANEWVEFTDGWRYFDGDGHMVYGDTVFGETTLEFSDKGVLNGNPCEGTNHIYSPDSGKCTLCGAYEDGISALGGLSVTLKDNVLINFFLELDETVSASPDTKVIIDGRELSVADGKVVRIDGKDYYQFTYAVAAKDVAKDITVRVVNGAVSGKTHTYSVIRYIDTLKKTETNPATLALVDALATYGEYARDFFDGGEYTMPELSGGIEATAPIKTGSLSSFTYSKTTLVLESTTAIRHYFTGSAEGITVEGGELVKEGDGLYYIEVKGIIPSMLDAEYEVIAKNTSGESVSIKCSALSYARVVTETASSEASLKNLMKALYLYGCAAKDYTGD